MILTRGKIIIIAIFIAIIAGLAGLIAFTNVETTQLETQVDIMLENVKMKSLDTQKNVMIIQVDFAVSNNAERTLTISKIDYELFANEKFLGNGFMSLENIPMVGRPSLFPKSSTTIPSEFQLKYSDNISDIWDLLATAEENNGISWRVKGNAEIESAFSIIPISFESSL
jgi:LEA14-like dessication related protein